MRRQQPASQTEKLWENPSLSTPQSWTSNIQNGEKTECCFLGFSVCIILDGGPKKHINGEGERGKEYICLYNGKSNGDFVDFALWRAKPFPYLLWNL